MLQRLKGKKAEKNCIAISKIKMLLFKKFED